MIKTRVDRLWGSLGDESLIYDRHLLFIRMCESVNQTTSHYTSGGSLNDLLSRLFACTIWNILITVIAIDKNVHESLEASAVLSEYVYQFLLLCLHHM